MIGLKLLTASDYQTSDWSGGKTQQLYLSPETGDYSKRHFDYRLSTATIEVDSSKFTALPGYDRILLTLDKTIDLANATRQEEIQLAPFTPYFFEGSDPIVSRGKCTDFNLIYKNHYQGQMMPVSGEQTRLTRDEEVQFLYALCDLTICINGEKKILQSKQLLIVENDAQEIELEISLETAQTQSPVVAIWAGLSET